MLVKEHLLSRAVHDIFNVLNIIQLNPSLYSHDGAFVQLRTLHVQKTIFMLIADIEDIVCYFLESRQIMIISLLCFCLFVAFSWI